MDFGVNEAGANGIDANALTSNFLGQTQGQAVDGAFGCGVIQVLARRAKPRSRARQVHNAAALAAMLGAHLQNGFARAKHRAQNIDIKHSAPARHAHFIEPRSDVDHTGVIDQALQGPQFGLHLFEHGQHLPLIRHIGLHCHCASTVGLNLLDHLLCRVGVGGVIDRHIPAFLSCQNACRSTDPAATPRDQ